VLYQDPPNTGKGYLAGNAATRTRKSRILPLARKNPLLEILERNVSFEVSLFINNQFNLQGEEKISFHHNVSELSQDSTAEYIPQSKVHAWHIEDDDMPRIGKKSSDARNLDILILKENLNNSRYLNKYLETVNANLSNQGFFVGCLETLQQRERRIFSSMFWPLNFIYYLFDYCIKRVWPKLPFFRRIYFKLTQGKNRVVSQTEMFGRLYSCGFKLNTFIELEKKLYFIASKVKRPDYNLDPTYGPFIYLNRLGKGGKRIKVYKFRTMYPYSEYLQEYIYEQNGLQSGGKFKNDPRVNSSGRFLRKYFLDELPMIINLIKGDLKLFGVRPLSKHYLSLYPESFQKYRHNFKPGLIPPYYVDMPKTLEEIIESEKCYLEAYEKRPLLTDLRYFGKAFYNIIIKRARGN
jgi:lipopolysaccharide/colanic/teichoic acid biosynthesis glycosyltransferase